MSEGTWSVDSLGSLNNNGYITTININYILTEDFHTQVESWSMYIDENNIPENYIPFNEVTEEIILNWCFNEMGEVKKNMIEQEARDLTNQILDDLVALLDPKYININAEFNVRGGIYTSVNVTHEK